MLDCDPVSGEPDNGGEGYADDYTLEDLEISVADHVQRQTHASFQAAWDALGDANELQVTVSLRLRSRPTRIT